MKRFRKYSEEWIRNLTSSDWDTEREKVRVAYLHSDIENADILMKLLGLFDRVKREQYDSSPVGFPAHREHGWWISKDD